VEHLKDIYAAGLNRKEENKDPKLFDANFTNYHELNWRNSRNSRQPFLSAVGAAYL